MQLIVHELIMDRVRRGAGKTDDGTDVLGDGIVELGEKALIAHDPRWVTTVLGGWRFGEVGAEPEFANEHIEEAAPFGVVRLGQIELDRDMRLDVEGLEDGDRRRSDRGRGVHDRGSRRFGVDIREVVLEEGIGVGVHGAGEVGSGTEQDG
jgi:hypothetical protein